MSVDAGRNEWNAQVAQLQTATLDALQQQQNPNSNSNNNNFNPSTYQYAPIDHSNNTSEFLRLEAEAFQAALWGEEQPQAKQQQSGAAAAASSSSSAAGVGGTQPLQPMRQLFPRYLPRVSMIDALHILPADPRATDAFRYSLPNHPDKLPRNGLDWLNMCENARKATLAKKEAMDAQRSAGAAAVAASSSSSSTATATTTVGTRNMQKLCDPGRQVNFVPIIIVPGGASAVVQLLNVHDLLENGVYAAPHMEYTNQDTGEVRLAEKDKMSVFVSPDKLLATERSVKFKTFRVVDSPAEVDNWAHVVACFVTGKDWQFKGWFGGEPGKDQPVNIFDIHLKAFLPFFEDEKVPDALKKWRVVPLQLSRRQTKAHMSLRVARIFWESVFDFLEAHPFFRTFTIAAPTKVAQ